MPQTVLRPMLPTDVDRATEMVLGHGWGVRREWLAFATESDRCTALVAELDGEIVATGVGTSNGPAGWLGSIFVAGKPPAGDLMARAFYRQMTIERAAL